jgi:Na+-transporting NADH:ubiquinone oxidoreductase subunit NqrB
MRTPIDARLYQIGFLASFLLLGFITRDWQLHIEVVLTAIAAALTTQYLCLKLKNSSNLIVPLSFGVACPEGVGDLGGSIQDLAGFSKSDFYSPMITALGLSVLLRVDHPWAMAFAAAIAVLSKFLLQFNQKHIFNPANFGIICAILFTDEAWVSPGQWGESMWYVGMFLICGGLVLKKVGRWDTTIAFLSFYFAMEAVRNVYLGWTWDVWSYRMMSGSLIMFSFFMITDPRTIPNAKPARIIWTFTIALITFILRNYFFMTTAVFFALFLAAPLTILLDWIFKDDRFDWFNLPSAITPEIKSV